MFGQHSEAAGLRILGMWRLVSSFPFLTRFAAFPCNQFGNQEPGTEAEIKQGVTEKYGVKFDMFSKADLTISATLGAVRVLY